MVELNSITSHSTPFQNLAQRKNATVLHIALVPQLGQKEECLCSFAFTEEGGGGRSRMKNLSVEFSSHYFHLPRVEQKEECLRSSHSSSFLRDRTHAATQEQTQSTGNTFTDRQIDRQTE